MGWWITRPGGTTVNLDDGYDETQGKMSDAAWSGAGDGTIVSILKKLAASGGGSAVSISDGSDVAQGSKADAAWVSGDGTVISLLKKIASAGGSAVSIADGADTAQGTTTDLSTASTTIGLLKAIKALLTGSLTVNVGLTDAQLRATPVPVSGTVTASGPLTDTQLRASRVPVDASGVAVPITDNAGSLTVDAPVGTPLWVRESDGAAAYVGQKVMASSKPVVIASDQTAVPENLTQIAGAAPSVTNPLPVRLSDGALFNFNQATYHLYQTPRVTTAAATDFFDLFNAAGSGKKLRILALFPAIQITAASAIIPSFEFSLIKTSAVGTGGTGHTFEGAAAPAAGALNIARADGTDATLPAQITSRSLPTGGATAAKFLFDLFLVSEETNAAPYLVQGMNWMPVGDAIKEVILAEGEGVKIRQITATASTGTNFGWLLVFTLV